MKSISMLFVLVTLRFIGLTCFGQNSVISA